MDPIREENKPPQHFYIQTFGCQMNVADTDQMRAILKDSGMIESPGADSADVLIVNGCSVREKPVHKAVSALGRIRKASSARASRVIGLGGCVGQLDGGAIFQTQPEIDFVFGPDTIRQLPEILHRVQHGERHLVYTDFDRQSDYSTETRILEERAQAFVNIMKGCDKYCTYCIVPFTRGREKSRTISEVLDDVAQLVAQGVKEVTLLGQNVNSFGKRNTNLEQRHPMTLTNRIGPVGPKEGEENFPQLLRALDQDVRLRDLRRIRFTSSHPLDFSDELIECYAERGGVSKLARHLHLPVQSGSNAVLKRMARHHQVEAYVDQMNRLREICPDVGISTDLIVGFPGETEEEFQETLRLLDQVQYDSVYAFAYSERPGTKAAKLLDDVSLEEKNRRLNHLLDYARQIGAVQHQKRVGRVMEILVEHPSKSQTAPGKKVWAGRTSCNSIVNFATESPRDLTGQLIQTRITDSTSLSLMGEWLPLEEERG